MKAENCNQAISKLAHTRIFYGKSVDQIQGFPLNLHLGFLCIGACPPLVGRVDMRPRVANTQASLISSQSQFKKNISLKLFAEGYLS